MPLLAVIVTNYSHRLLVEYVHRDEPLSVSFKRLSPIGYQAQLEPRARNGGEYLKYKSLKEINILAPFLPFVPFLKVNCSELPRTSW